MSRQVYDTAGIDGFHRSGGAVRTEETGAFTLFVSRQWLGRDDDPGRSRQRRVCSIYLEVGDLAVEYIVADPDRLLRVESIIETGQAEDFISLLIREGVVSCVALIEAAEAMGNRAGRAAKEREIRKVLGIEREVEGG